MRAALQKAVSELEKQLVNTPIKPSLKNGPMAVSYNSWTDYARTRGLNKWLGSEKTGEEFQLREMLLSKLLSYPLTLARHLNDETLLLKDKNEIEIHVLGARAEATLPPLYWNELFSCSFALKRIKLVFVGPQVNIALDGKTKQYGESLHLQFKQCTYENTDIKQPDVFYLCNSGIGNVYESGFWKPTIETKLYRSSAKGIFTSFNEQDFEADLQAVRLQKNFISIDKIEELNPMRSLWTEKDHDRNILHSNNSSFIASFNPNN